MKIRWRQHEIVFASVALAIAITGFWWKMLHLPAPQFDNTYKLPFANNGHDFNFYRNLLLPQIGIFVIVYGTILWMNLFITPRLTAYKQLKKSRLTAPPSAETKRLDSPVIRVIRRYLWLFIQLALLLLIMGTGLNIVGYFFNEYNFHGAGFTFFPGNGHHQQTLMNYQEGYENAGAFLTGYCLYLWCREFIIARIQRPGSSRNYWVLVCNHITAFAVFFLSVPFFLASFNLADNTFFNVYYATFIPVFLVFMLNTYWVFPLTTRQTFFTWPIIFKILLSCLVASLPFATLSFANEASPLAYVTVCWLVLLLVVTPVTWLFFQQRRDKILQLKGTEQALMKSTTDLQSLRLQINPHFLYNILNTLYGTALQENAERTATGVQQLGDMMRFMLDENHLDYIPMRREIEYLNNYIALQKLRFPIDAPLTIETDINATNCDHVIAPMMLIPFVENAFKHGIRLGAVSWIKISLACKPTNVHFEVRNSMHAASVADPEKERSGIGLANVVQRLKLVYPGKFQLSANGDRTEYVVILHLNIPA